jgi:hypothetical protein
MIIRALTLALTLVFVTSLSPADSRMTAAGFAVVAGPRLDDGTEVQCDLPATLHMKNTGGRDGAGLCVFTSIEHSGRWHAIPELDGLQAWMTTQPGGGYPEKVSHMLAQFCRKHGDVPDYYQAQDRSRDRQLVELLAEAVQAGHLVCVTYSHSPTGRYGGQRIAHMVNCVAARSGPRKLWAILDNNFPKSIEWMNEAAFVDSVYGAGQAWAIFFPRPGPPPVPSNE